MTRSSHNWPGGEVCPLERWRARVVVWLMAALALASFVIVFGIVWGR